MVKGLYTAYTGLANQQNRLDVVTNNLANATTTGYKKEGTTAQSFDSLMAIKINDPTSANINQNIGTMSLGVKIGENYRDYSQGSFKSTSGLYDFALSGSGLFSIDFTSKTGQESIMYTRDGSFQMAQDGSLVTKDGDFVLGQDGPIVLPTNATISVDETGGIYADGQYIDKFAITDFEDNNYLEQYGENMYRAVDGATKKDATATVMQKYLEMSNVNVVSEMVQMITISRSFESSQKVMNSIDETLQKAVTLGQL
ncbi:flagellar hook-basal body protein [[Clostridium] fimetarium]|uniref:Flagellar basal-body rod protein FlgG n=1 Tax=[Clostridium] fimetarium TaxID=99656 RepID=A0A1I0P3E7_9FIRM|nr:flagellar hook-basal body protein [[Clostridium] fimetarium]SEW08688.1 flagellar basal-body rod protein FlgG [[Clostridium] fimetarium]